MGMAVVWSRYRLSPRLLPIFYRGWIKEGGEHNTCVSHMLQRSEDLSSLSLSSFSCLVSSFLAASGYYLGRRRRRTIMDRIYRLVKAPCLVVLLLLLCLTFTTASAEGGPRRPAITPSYSTRAAQDGGTVSSSSSSVVLVVLMVVVLVVAV